MMEAKKENNRKFRGRRWLRRRSRHPSVPYLFGCSVALFSIITYNEIQLLLTKKSAIEMIADELAESQAQDEAQLGFEEAALHAARNIALPNVDSGKVFEDELQKLKKYEAQLERRVQSLDMLLGEIERLDNGVMDGGQGIWSAKPMKGSNFGGGDAPRAALSHNQKNLPHFSVNSSKSIGVGEPVTLLLNTFDRKLNMLSRMPLGAPLNTEVTSGFGWRTLHGSRRGHMHSGVDFSVERRTPIVATADGVVVTAGYKSGYGNSVMILHGNGIETLYGHLDKITAKLGDKICRGETLGFAGSTGRSTGPHLHYEVRVDGEPRDPRPYIELASFARLLKPSETDDS